MQIKCAAHVLLCGICPTMSRLQPDWLISICNVEHDRVSCMSIPAHHRPPAIQSCVNPRCTERWQSVIPLMFMHIYVISFTNHFRMRIIMDLLIIVLFPQQTHYRQISAAFEWILIVTFNLYFSTFALEFRTVRLSHSFKHYQGGSWVGFTALPTSEPAVVVIAEEAAGTETTGRRLNYHGNNSLQGTCHHSDGSMHVMTVGTICPNVGTSV